MLIGVFFGIAACMIWGCVYVAPLILPDYSPVHIAMMRYLVFGMLAAGLAVPEVLSGVELSPIRRRTGVGRLHSVLSETSSTTGCWPRPANAQERRLQAPSRR